MTSLLFILLMAFLARASGGGWPAPWLSEKIKWDGLPELLFGLAFGIALYIVSGSVWCGLAVWIWSYAWMETGHGDVLQWGRYRNATRETHTLSPLVEFITDRLGFQCADKNYCRVYMAVKGFLIGLPVGGILLAVLWPLAYEINRGREKENLYDGLDEMLSGAFAGISILTFVYLFG